MLDIDLATQSHSYNTEILACGFLRLGLCFTILICTRNARRPMHWLHPLDAKLLLMDKASDMQGELQGWLTFTIPPSCWRRALSTALRHADVEIRTNTSQNVRAAWKATQAALPYAFLDDVLLILRCAIPHKTLRNDPWGRPPGQCWADSGHMRRVSRPHIAALRHICGSRLDLDLAESQSAGARCALCTHKAFD